MPISIDCFKAYDIRGRIPDQLNPDIAYSKTVTGTCVEVPGGAAQLPAIRASWSAAAWKAGFIGSSTSSTSSGNVPGAGMVPTPDLEVRNLVAVAAFRS